MIFLNPAVLFGLLAASIPVLIHLLNLRKLKKIEFSTLAFLKELQKNKIRKIKIKQWLLLALRVAIILFLVFAFARPTLEGLAIGGTTSAAKTSAVFIIDDTFSMSVVDGKGSYLNQAKETMKSLMNQLQEGDDAALIRVSSASGEVRLSNNLQGIRKEINDVTPSYASGYLHNALIKAAGILAESKNFNKEIYLLSDFQSSGISDDKNLSDMSELLNDKVKLYSFDYSGKEVFNTGIDELKLNTQIFEKDKPVSFKVKVTNYSRGSSLNNGVVSLFINGERSAQQSITLGAGESTELEMEAVLKSTGQLDVFAELEDDDILQDNRHYLSMYVPEEVPVIIFSDANSDAQFIDLALSAVNNEGSLRVTSKNLNQLPSVNLSQYDVVIIVGSSGSQNTGRIKDFVDNGGGLFLIPGSSGNYQVFNQFISAIGLPSASGESGNNTDNAVSFQNTDFNHPVFQNIFSGKGKKAIESPDIYRHYKLNSGGKGIRIISLMDDSGFLNEYKSGKGKIFVLATAPVLSWSNLPLKSIFAPLINKSIFYLASKDIPEEEYSAGSKVDIKLSDLTIPQLKILKPDKSEEFINLQEPVGNYVPYSGTDINGNYLVYSGEKIVDNFSINSEARESKVDYSRSTGFESYLKKIGFKGNYIVIDKNDDPSKVILQARFGSELWKLFLLIALVLAVAEMAIARNVKKDLAETAQS